MGRCARCPHATRMHRATAKAIDGRSTKHGHVDPMVVLLFKCSQARAGQPICPWLSSSFWTEYKRPARVDGLGGSRPGDCTHPGASEIHVRNSHPVALARERHSHLPTAQHPVSTTRTTSACGTCASSICHGTEVILHLSYIQRWHPQRSHLLHQTIGYNIVSRPRITEQTSFEQLRNLAALFDGIQLWMPTLRKVTRDA